MVFSLSSKSKTWHDIQNLYKRNNIIFIFLKLLLVFFRELKSTKKNTFLITKIKIKGKRKVEHIYDKSKII